MSTRAAAAVLPLPSPSSAAAALPNPVHPPLRCCCQRPCTADAVLPTPLHCTAALQLPCAATNFDTSAQPQMRYCRCAAKTCVNWPFSRTHLPVTLTNFSYRPFFGIHMEVLDAKLEQIQNRFTVCQRRDCVAEVSDGGSIGCSVAKDAKRDTPRDYCVLKE